MAVTDTRRVSEPAFGQSLPIVILVGILSAAFFSSTWIINRQISLADGPWEWNAILRYPIVLALIAPWLALRGRERGLGAALRCFGRRPGYWILAGSLGCGVFYLGICFAGDRAPGWVLATTWQVTILVSPLVLRLFGLRVPMRGLLLMALVFIGVSAINLSQIRMAANPLAYWFAAGALLIAAIAYPAGNQMLNLARNAPEATGSDDGNALFDPIAGLFLMSLGSLPFWAIMLAITRPAQPEGVQIAQITVVAVSSGVIATGLFFWARNATADPYVIAAVDATQSFEIVFTVLGEAILLGGAWPGIGEGLGILLVMIGVVGLSRRGSGGAASTQGPAP